jgi:hypothetical protein
VHPRFGKPALRYQKGSVLLQKEKTVTTANMTATTQELRESLWRVFQTDYAILPLLPLAEHPSITQKDVDNIVDFLYAWRIVEREDGVMPDEEDDGRIWFKQENREMFHRAVAYATANWNLDEAYWAWQDRVQVREHDAFVTLHYS